jgi:molecular chaperone Hsp33
VTDSLQRFLFEYAPVRCEFVHLDATWRAVLERHDYPPALQRLLGELMAAVALLSATVKLEGSIVLQMQGSGPVKLVVVECTSERTLRATAKWEGEIHAAPIARMLGQGRFVITIVPSDAKQTYQGIVTLDGDTVAEVLEHYMVRSEQLETRFWLACDGHRAAGMLLQKLPASASRRHQDADAWDRALTLSETLTREELLDLPAEQVVHRLFHQELLRAFEATPVSFRCSCTREKVAAMLRMLGLDEVRSIVAERGGIEVACEFCNRRYDFDAVDAEQLFATRILLDPDPTRH